MCQFDSHGRLGLVWLLKCDKFDVFQTIFEQFGGSLRSRWKFEIEIEARCTRKQLCIAVLLIRQQNTVTPA